MSTRKHFVAVAKEIAQMENRDEARGMAERMAAIFSKENPRFDLGRFMAACGIKANQP